MRKLLVVVMLASACNSETPAQEMKKAEEKQRAIDDRQAEEQAKLAQKRAEEALRAAEEAAEKVRRLETDMAEMDKKVGVAVDSVVAAQTDADRASAKSKLEALRKEKADMERRIAEAKAAAAAAKRKAGFKVSAECQANPLAKGCM